jgi:lipopolysaccharide/colanic/teichoic acid biosynthesis glycosyltransferase
MLVEAARQPDLIASPVNAGLPRWADAAIAAIVLIIAAPVIALLGFAIVATSGLPIFFQQGRVGLHGELFNLYKLRTMTVSESGAQITSRTDKRITRLGRLLRKTKLDELPTFWNVLRGDLALVGPRPEVPAFVDLSNPSWRTILSVRPGLTDPVTISLRNEEELLAHAGADVEQFYVSELQPAKLRGYLEYLQRRTLRSDVVVLSRTIIAIIRH